MVLFTQSTTEGDIRATNEKAKDRLDYTTWIDRQKVSLELGFKRRKSLSHVSHPKKKKKKKERSFPQ